MQNIKMQNFNMQNFKTQMQNIKLDDVIASVIELLKVGLSAIYYPIWILCSLIHSLPPFKEGARYNKLFDEETAKDKEFILNSLLKSEQIKPNEEEKQARDKIVRAILKITAFDTVF